MDNNFNNQNDNQSFGQSTYTNQSYDAQNFNNPTYGNQPYQSESYYSYQPSVQPPVIDNSSKAMAIVSLVCGILSIVFMCCSYLALICGIVAIVLAVIYKSKTVYKKFDGMSLAGLICGIIGTLASGMFILISLFSGIMNIASY